MVPHIRGQRRYGRPVALVTAVLLLLLAPNAAVAATPSWLDPQASWHGRAIERPLPAGSATTRATASDRTVSTVSSGAGFATANGSAAVRRVQRILRQLGYGTGRVDGRFGPRTRSAVAWFQVKHGLSVDGIAGPRTLQRLSERSRAGSDATTSEPEAPTPSAPDADAPSVVTPTASDTGDPADRWLAAALAVGLILVATLLALLWRRRRRTADGTVVSLAQPLWVAGVSADPAIGAFAGTAAALHVSPPATDGSDAPPTIRYCVMDDETGAPLWVLPQDIRESRGLDDRTRRHAAGLPVAHPGRAAGGRFDRPGVRPRRGRSTRRPRPAGASQLERRVTWFRSLGMPSDAIADLLTDEQVPPPQGHGAWTAQAVAEVDGGGEQDQAPAAVGRPAQPGGPSDAREGRGD